MGNYGLNTAAYFMLDNVGASRPEDTQELQVLVGNNIVDLTEYFSTTVEGSTSTYAVVETTGDVTAAISGNELNLDVAASAMGRRAPSTDDPTVLVSHTNRGRTQWLRLVLKVGNPTGVETIEAANGYTVNGRTIALSGNGAIYNAAGAQLASGNQATLDVVPGIYVVVTGGHAHKVLVK